MTKSRFDKKKVKKKEENFEFADDKSFRKALDFVKKKHSGVIERLAAYDRGEWEPIRIDK